MKSPRQAVTMMRVSASSIIARRRVTLFSSLPLAVTIPERVLKWTRGGYPERSGGWTLFGQEGLSFY